MSKRTRIFIAIIAVVGAVIVLASVFGGQPNVNVSDGVDDPQTSTSQLAAPSTKSASKAEPKLTTSQKQAMRAIDGYQAFAFFSESGLVNQLVMFDKFTKADAKVAVAASKINWNEQAVKKAQQYLSATGFSYEGLIHQMTAFDKFTKAQATYGAKAAFNAAD